MSTEQTTEPVEQVKQIDVGPWIVIVQPNSGGIGAYGCTRLKDAENHVSAIDGIAATATIIPVSQALAAPKLVKACERVANELNRIVCTGDLIHPNRLESRIKLLRAALPA